MPDMIEMNCNQGYIMYISKNDTYGGKRYEFNFSQEITEMLEWYRKHKEQMLKESKAREQFESVASAYEQYQTTLKLVLD
jgi:hypothetical protein